MVAVVKDEQVIVQVPVGAIAVAAGRRSLNEAGVEELMRSIEAIGLRQPIEVTEDYHLITGLHRLTAFQRLGRDKIPAVVSHLDRLHRELVEIDENLVRSNLTKLEAARALARKKEIYEALHPETRHGARRITGMNRDQNGRLLPKAQQSPKDVVITPFGDDSPVPRVPSFVDDTARRLGTSRSTVAQAVRIGRTITPQTEAVIKGTPVENRLNDLLGLAQVTDPGEQQTVAQTLVDRAASTGGKRKRKVVEETGKQRSATVPKEVVKQVRALNRVFERLEATDPKTAAKYHSANDREYAAARMQRMVEWAAAFIAAARPGS